MEDGRCDLVGWDEGANEGVRVGCLVGWSEGVDDGDAVGTWD